MMKQSGKQNSGFSLIELIIALAVLAFLMLAVSSFMGSSITQTRKAKVDVRMQSTAQETYSLLTDTLMQAKEIVIAGYTSSAALDFSDAESYTSSTVTKLYLVKDDTTKQNLIVNPARYGVNESVDESKVKLFSEINEDTPIYISELYVESSVPLDISQTGDSVTVGASQYTGMTNHLTNETNITIKYDSATQTYSQNDTLASVFYFNKEKLYYGRTYAFMQKLSDPVDMTDAESQQDHLYNKYFSYVTTGTKEAPGDSISGCVATINPDDSTIGIDLYYNQSNMTYTTLGRINMRNSYVLKPKN